MTAKSWQRGMAPARGYGPQFQENHVFSEPSIQLLMGRRWLLSQKTWRKLKRFAASSAWRGARPDALRFNQMLGESGWQLSHGERSRLTLHVPCSRKQT